MDPKKIRPVVTKHRVHLTESFQNFGVFFSFLIECYSQFDLTLN